MKFKNETIKLIFFKIARYLKPQVKIQCSFNKIASLVCVSLLLLPKGVFAASGLVDLGYGHISPIPNEDGGNGLLLGLNFPVPWSDYQFFGIQGYWFKGSDRSKTSTTSASGSESADKTDGSSVSLYYKFIFQGSVFFTPFVSAQAGTFHFDQTCQKDNQIKCIGIDPPSEDGYSFGGTVGFYMPYFSQYMPFIQATSVQTTVADMKQELIVLIGFNFTGKDISKPEKVAEVSK